VTPHGIPAHAVTSVAETTSSIISVETISAPINRNENPHIRVSEMNLLNIGSTIPATSDMIANNNKANAPGLTSIPTLPLWRATIPAIHDDE
jgi:hypothetical protein